MSEVAYRLLADLVLTTHVGFVLFVVAGLVAVLAGGIAGWSWVRNPWFRGLHVLAILVVAAQAWLGRVCPLTTLEMWLRSRAGSATYEGSFLAHWLEEILYIDAPMWAFAVSYTAFACLVIGAWFCIPPRRRRHAAS